MVAADLVPEALLKQVVSVLAPRQVILFGSRARGDARSDSDYDLVIVLDDETPDERVTWQRRYQARKGYSADIVPCRETALKERARAVGSFAHTVVTEGVVVYERP